MDCFALDEWVGFARRIVLPERRAEMQRHLDAGCTRCAQAVQMWRSVLDLAAKESAYEPPPTAVRFVKQYYADHLPRRAKGMTMVARLIFDSTRHRMPPGVRTSSPLSQQLLFAAGDYLVHVRLERGSKGFSLVGQVQNSSKPWDILKDCPVALVKGRQVVAQAVTSRFGEFEFAEFEVGNDLGLVVGLDRESSIVISFEDLTNLGNTGPDKGPPAPWPRSSTSPKSSGGRGPDRAHD